MSNSNFGHQSTEMVVKNYQKERNTLSNQHKSAQSNQKSTRKQKEIIIDGNSSADLVQAANAKTIKIACSTKKNKSNQKILGKRKRDQNRVRKDESQIQQLIQEFRKDSDWSKEHVTYLAKTIGLSESQVYKWAWDQKKKLNNHSANGGLAYSLTSTDALNASSQDTMVSAQPIQATTAEVTRDEFGGYCCKRWSRKDDKASISTAFDDAQDDNICRQLGIDINAIAQKLVRSDLKRRQLIKSSPFSAKNKSNHINLTDKQFGQSPKPPVPDTFSISSSSNQKPSPKNDSPQDSIQAKLAKMLTSPRRADNRTFGSRLQISPQPTNNIRNDMFLTPDGYQMSSTQDTSASTWKSAGVQSKQNVHHPMMAEFYDGAHMSPVNLQHNFREQTSSPGVEDDVAARYQRASKRLCTARNRGLKQTMLDIQQQAQSGSQTRTRESYLAPPIHLQHGQLSPTNMLGSSGNGAVFNPSPYSTKNHTPSQQQLKSPLLCSQFRLRFGESNNI